jgi:hypothetical protein
LVPDVVPAGSDLDADPTCQSLIRLESTGTKDDAMVERARPKAEHALRVLRVALRTTRSMIVNYGFGWAGRQHSVRRTRSEVCQLARATRLTSSPTCATSSPTTSSPLSHPTPHIEKRPVRALKWLERARFEDDPTVTCLFVFFALEALLGDTASGEKASHLCFYRCVLGEMAGRGFRHPFATYFLYDRVRSKAVHGSESVEIDEDVVKKLGVGRAERSVRTGHLRARREDSQALQAAPGHA